MLFFKVSRLSRTWRELKSSVFGRTCLCPSQGPLVEKVKEIPRFDGVGEKSLFDVHFDTQAEIEVEGFMPSAGGKRTEEVADRSSA